jgi:hypothetical protein
MQQRFRLLSGLLAMLAAGVWSSSGWAAEEFRLFLRGLLDQGRGELAVYYLNQIKDRADLPEDVKTIWDLEMARSLRVAANETPNVDLQQKYTLDAQQSLDKFLKEHPNHEEAAAAQMTSGDISLFRAQNMLKIALRDRNQKDTLIPEARKLFAAARSKYLEAEKLYKARIDAVRADLKVKKKFASQRAENQYLEMVESWYNARFKVATVDYNVGLSYTETADPNRKKVLQEAFKGFDSIYQEDRDGRIGIYAKMWEGKALEELGDYVTALEIYDEVMVAQPPVKDQRLAQWAAMFQEVNRYRLMLLGRTKNYERLVAEARDWLARNDSIKRSPGYQGIALELAKAYLELSKTLTGSEAASASSEAKRLLSAIVATNVPSEFQKEAILLLRLSSGGDAPIASFDEAIAVADAAAKAASEATKPADAKKNWEEAEKAYRRAIELSGTLKNPKDQVRVLHARFALATTQYMVNKPAEGYATALALAKENVSYEKAPAAASLAVNIALYLYGQTRDAAALERITESTELLLKQWPQHAEADDARIAKGKLKLLQNPPDFKGAIETFLSVNPASDRYPGALQLAGQTHWVLYNNEKRKGNSAAADAERAKAAELLDKSLAAFAKVENGGANLAQALQETQLLIAEMRLEAGQVEESLEFLQPMVDELKNQPRALDRTALRILVNALRAYSLLGRVPQTIEVGNMLIDGGDDLPPVNATLIEFAKTVKGEWKKASAELISAEQSGEEGRINNAKMLEATGRESLAKVLEKLNERKQYDLAGLVFLAESSAEIGLNEKARDQFQAIVDRAAADQAFARQAAPAMTRVRSQLIGLLRAEKKYEEALQQVDALLKQQPNALEPMMERGHILQALAESNPARYDEAIKWWTDIRSRLQKIPGKKPPEYYEAIYNCAVCLLAKKKPEQNKQASQLLNTTLALSPTLDGPDRVAKYKALLKQIP